MYIDLKAYLYYPVQQVVQMNIDLGRYPQLQKALENIFSMKRSLVDLARILEKELLIYEVQRD